MIEKWHQNQLGKWAWFHDAKFSQMRAFWQNSLVVSHFYAWFIDSDSDFSWTATLKGHASYFSRIFYDYFPYHIAFFRSKEIAVPIYNSQVHNRLFMINSWLYRPLNKSRLGDGKHLLCIFEHFESNFQIADCSWIDTANVRCEEHDGCMRSSPWQISDCRCHFQRTNEHEGMWSPRHHQGWNNKFSSLGSWRANAERAE